MAAQHLLPQNLRVWRERQGFTLRQVSLQTGIPVPSLSAYERFQMRAPIDRLIQLASLYAVSLDCLCGLSQPRNGSHPA